MWISFFQSQGTGFGPEGREPRRNERSSDPAELANTGLTIFLISLAVLFCAALVGYAMTRLGVSEWRSPWTRGALGLIALASLALGLADLSMSRARRRELAADARRDLALGLFVAGVYLALQTLLFFQWSESIRAERRVEVATLATLAALHGIHVLGGVVGGALAWWRLGQVGDRNPGPNLERLFRYWRFLSLVWVVMLAALLV